MGDGVSWRFVNATARGTSHERSDTPCQDDCIIEVLPHGSGETLIAVVSDGAGSAACAEEGSGLVCETLLTAIEQWLQDGGTVDGVTREAAEQWLTGARTAIGARAEAKGLAPRDFACTLVAAIVGASSAAFLQVGDGAIVAGRAGALDVVFWPDGGEYANMTYFITDDDWRAHLQLAVREAAFEDVALMTDGLQRLALQFDRRCAHAPFFEPMFHALAAAPPGFATPLEASLVAFLGSDGVNARTDDDKSLVLATRRAGAADGAV
jgi:Protein phosphatase 2C